MAKTTAEPVWTTQTDGHSDTGWAMGINRVVHNSVTNLRPLVNAVCSLFCRTNNKSCFSLFIRHQQEKARDFEQSIKDEFYQCGGFAGHNKVPGRVWKRHSALLVYRDQVFRQGYYK